MPKELEASIDIMKNRKMGRTIYKETDHPVSRLCKSKTTDSLCLIHSGRIS